MIESIEAFLEASESDRVEVFEESADKVKTLGSNIEKDFWVCAVLDILFNKQQDEDPDLYFKGGTSLSKCFNLIDRFSEDVDIVVCRKGLSFSGDRDPANPNLDISNKERKRLLEDLTKATHEHVAGTLAQRLRHNLPDGCELEAETKDGQANLVIYYPTVFPKDQIGYVEPKVIIEAGARSSREPSKDAKVAPYISDVEGIPYWEVSNIRAIAPERTFWEKVLLLHSNYRGYKNKNKLPKDKNRSSRHYLDVVTLADSYVYSRALNEVNLLRDVREHTNLTYRRAWAQYDLATPGSLTICPYDELEETLREDYEHMKGMVFGDAPQFSDILDYLRNIESEINALDIT
mgnify:CR=1 FL=1